MANRDGVPRQLDIREWLNQNSDVIKACFDEDISKVGPLDVKVQGVSKFCTILHVWQENTHRRIKVFNPDIPINKGYCYREAQLLSALSGTGLAPRLHYADVEACWYISDWIVGRELFQSVTPDNVVDISREVGAWIAKYTKVISRNDKFVETGAEHRMTWRDYLVQYGGTIKKVAMESDGDFTASLALETRVVAKDDPHFGNYIRSRRGKLFGIDYEMSSLRPYGWDIMVSARALLRTYPGPGMEHIDALVDGWGQGTDCLDKETFRKLVRWFAEKTAFDVNNPTVESFRGVLHAYNKAAEVPAAKILQVPSHRDEIEPVDAGIKTVLAERISTIMEGEAENDLAYEAYLAGRDAPEDSGTAAVGLRMAKACETCRGSCCSLGTHNVAYLKKDAIYRAARHLGTRSLPEVIKAYMDHVPDEHVMGSCFYHTTQGCALPREMRSTICNTYQCGAVRALNQIAAELEPDVPVLVVAGSESLIDRAVAVTQTTAHAVDVTIEVKDDSSAA